MQASEFSGEQARPKNYENGHKKQFWPFRRFIIECQKLGPFLVTKYIKNQSYQNMILIKELSYFVFFNEKKT